jgi:hypothetical protein
VYVDDLLMFALTKIEMKLWGEIAAKVSSTTSLR